VLDMRAHELVGFERRAKRAAARVQSHLGGPDAVVHLDAHGTRKTTSWREFLLYNKDHELRPTEGNTLTILENDEQFAGCLVLDKFRAQWVWVRQPPGDLHGPFPRPMRPEDVHFIQQWLERSHGLVVGAKTVAAKLSAVASRNSVDALTAYLEECEAKWDRKPRIDMFLSMCAGCADTPHTRAVGRRFLISGAARGLEPGAKVDTMLVLEGPQGVTKSTLLNMLAGGHGEHGQSWHTDNVPVDVESKDAAMALAGHFIVEWAEFDRFYKTDRAALKDFLSRRVDKFRPPYAAETVMWPRRCIFAATTNASTYFDDATGARRYWVVRVVKPLRLDLVRKYRDQMWGEAVHCARAALKALAEHRQDTRNQWWLTPEEDALAAAEAEDAYSPDPWEAELGDWAAMQPYLTTRDALRHLGVAVDKASRKDQMRLSDVFLRLGYGAGVAEDGKPARRRVDTGTSREYRFFRTVKPAVTPLPALPPISEVGGYSASENKGFPTCPTCQGFFPCACARASEKNTHLGRVGREVVDSSSVLPPYLWSEQVGQVGGQNKPVQLTIADIWGEGVEWGGA
jgi:predicted P-loop ATPase